MKKNIILLGLLMFSSCSKEKIYETPCNGDCDTSYEVLYKNTPIFPNSNGHYEIDWDGLNYFQIEGQLSELKDTYVINGVPLIEANFDSDYWVVFDTLQFQIPMYSYLGWFNDQGLNQPISIDTFTLTLSNLIDLHPPTNVAGYQIPKYFCIECPYAPTLLGSHSKYTYTPKQNFMIDNEIIGDTINVFIETIFNSDVGNREVIEDQLKVIIQ
jgi:hypothetical protein